jgi:hypothetical protein
MFMAFDLFCLDVIQERGQGGPYPRRFAGAVSSAALPWIEWTGSTPFGASGDTGPAAFEHGMPLSIGKSIPLGHELQ